MPQGRITLTVAEASTGWTYERKCAYCYARQKLGRAHAIERRALRWNVRLLQLAVETWQHKIAVPLLALLALSVHGGTFYVDFTNGNDANNGTSKLTPWKRHPYMQGWTGTYSHVSGDHFIFKGGETWTNCFLTITNGGAFQTNDYYGVDKTWFTGSSWTRPVFDGSVEQAQRFVRIGPSGPVSNLTFDNLEMKGLYWSGAVGAGSVYFFNRFDGSSNIILANLYIHDWTHGTAGAGTTDSLICIWGGSAAPYDLGMIATNLLIDGGTFNSTNNASSGAAFKQYGGTITNCTIRNCVSGILAGPGNNSPHIGHCNIGPTLRSFDVTSHDNGIEVVIGGGGWTIHDNYVHDGQSVELYICANANEEDYLYNNVIYNFSGNNPILLSTQANPVKAHIFNNTIVSPNNYAVRIDNKGTTFDLLDIANNHVIGASSGLYTVDTGASITTVTNIDNVIVSAATASAQGYVLGNLYQPTSFSASSVGAGTNLISELSGVLATDILGASRTNRWDVGAYEFSGSPPPPPTGLTILYNATIRSGTVR